MDNDMYGFRKMPKWVCNTAMLFMVMLGFGNELPEFTQERIQRSAFGYKETQAMVHHHRQSRQRGCSLS